MPTFERSELELYYAEQGSGPVVVLHTGGAGDGEMFRSAGFVDALAANGYRAVAYDHRGHGRSVLAPRPADHRLGEYVADVEGLLDALGANRAAIVGYSFGIDVAIALAATHPERVAAVVGIGAVGAADDPTDWAVERAAFIRDHGTAAAIEAFVGDEAQPPPGWLIENLSATESEMLALLLEASADDDSFWKNLSHVTAPMLLVCGELEEDEAGQESGLAARNVTVAATMAHGETFVVPGLAHLAIFWRTDLTLPTILGFLRRHYPPERG